MELDTATIILILYCVLAFVLAFFPAYFIFPKFIRKMKSLGNTGKDVNKRGNIQVAEPQASEARCGRGRAELVSAQKTSSEVFQGAKDLHKLDRSLVSGGIVAVFSFSLAMFVISGLASIFNYHENIVLPLQAATTVFIAAAIIGFIREEEFANSTNLRADADDRLSGRRCRRLGLVVPQTKGIRHWLREVRWNAQGISLGMMSELREKPSQRWDG